MVWMVETGELPEDGGGWWDQKGNVVGGESLTGWTAA